MSWVRLDDQFFTHPKVLRAGRDARDLYLASLTYCARHLTDGHIATEALPMLGVMAEIMAANDSAARLVEVGLWEPEEHGYLVHDYLDYNRSREEELAVKEARAEAGARGGVASAAAKAASKSQANCLPAASDIFKQTPTPSTSTSTSTLSLDPNGSKDTAKQPSQPLQPYESAFLELFEFRSGRYPTKAMRSLVQGMVQKYGDGEFLAAAKIAAERNVRKLPYVEGILKNGGAKHKPATAINGPPGAVLDERGLIIAIGQARRDKRKLYCEQCGTLEGMYHGCKRFRYVPQEFVVRKQNAEA